MEISQVLDHIMLQLKKKIERQLHALILNQGDSKIKKLNLHTPQGLGIIIC